MDVRTGFVYVPAALSCSIQSRGLYQRIKSSIWPLRLAALKLDMSDRSEALIICRRSSAETGDLK